MNLYILKYNNYYNRTIKKEDSLTDYLQYQLGNVIQGVAFNPGDGVATQQVVNLTEDQIGDYLLAVNEYNEIDSRWFILDCRRERTGQYTLTLRRDLVTDNYTTIINAPCFIEKATLDDADPFIYNSEDMTFNEIKKSETLLKDETGIPWIVGFLESNQDVNVSIPAQDVSVYQTVSDITTWEFYKYKDEEFVPALSRMTLILNIGNDDRDRTYRYYIEEDGLGTVPPDLANEYVNGSGYVFLPKSSASSQLYWYGPNPNLDYGYGVNRTAAGAYDIQRKLKANWDTINLLYKSYVSYHTEEETEEFRNLDGKIIYDDTTSTFYKVTLEYGDSVTKTADITSGSLFEHLKNDLLNLPAGIPNSPFFGQEYITGNGGKDNFSSEYVYKPYKIKLSVISVNTYDLNITTDRPHLSDAPYDMFCIPYGELDIYSSGLKIFTVNPNVSLSVVTEIMKKYKTATYDAMLLPYCPVRNFIKSDGTFDLMGNEGKYFNITSDKKAENIVLFANSSSFTLDIPYKISINNKKVESQTDKYRLCSPNYNGIFEFNAAMNGGVNFFNVDCTYKPYAPYIHINPDFGSLYGEDFNDSRGLLCGGDFGLPRLDDSWQNYQQQNANYQNIFDRQIQNMEVNNAVQREKQKWQIASGAVGAGMGGALTGALVGGPIGAIVGGVIGAGASTAAGIRDYQLSEQLRQEAIDYTTDQFGYQLGNIKALPNSLSRTSALTYNNKLFPFLEFYSCTDEEKRALENKIKYNGMTVMRIGIISDFIKNEPTYIKGRLIRFEGTDNNFHVVNEIANEINKGVFI